MIESCTRRHALLTLCSTVVTACASASGARDAPADHPVPLTGSDPASLDEIESSVGGRVGVFAIDTGTGRSLAHRENERFAMCSTFKWALAAAVLGMVDRSEAALGERVPYGKADLLEYAPVTTEHVAEGAMTLDALARAAVVVSDNTAANLLLAKVGGPAGLTRFFRAAGDPVTRLDRNEPTLNENDPGELRDTTSPQAMVGLMRALLCGDALSRPSRERLLGWMQACETGRRRLRAGFPADWTVGDKTGTGDSGVCNDLAIAVPPGRAPILVAAFLSDGRSSVERLEAAHAGIARLVALRCTSPETPRPPGASPR